MAAGKSEFGVCGVVGGMMVIERMRGIMRGGELAVECWDCKQMANVRGERNGECDYIRFDFFHVGHLRLLQRARSVV